MATVSMVIILTMVMVIIVTVLVIVANVVTMVIMVTDFLVFMATGVMDHGKVFKVFMENMVIRHEPATVV